MQIHKHHMQIHKHLMRIQRSIFVIIAIIAVIFGGWIYWAIHELTYEGDPVRINEINIAVAQYAAAIEPTQSPEISTWYFNKAHHYISEFALVNSTNGDTVQYQCSWPENLPKADVASICSSR